MNVASRRLSDPCQDRSEKSEGCKQTTSSLQHWRISTFILDFPLPRPGVVVCVFLSNVWAFVTTLVMVFNIIDTPRTEIGDQTRMSGLNDIDLSTQHSIPSPSKKSNDLLNQIRGMRPSTTRTPRTRAPLLDRRNLPSKAEFTPVLKSAARNSYARTFDSKENARPIQTPAGMRGMLAADSPALPFNSSVIFEEHTTTSDQDDGQGPSIAPPISSSSPVSTPLAPRQGDGPLDARGNLATLREQEAVRRERYQ